MGSTADRTRVDEWSDHDFAVVCEPGNEEELRGDLSWLPDFGQLMLAAREQHDGFKALYRDGSVVEFAVTSVAGLAHFHANAWAVAYGDEHLTETMHAVAGRVKPLESVNPTLDMTVFLVSLLIGVGRARRGEGLGASGSVRGLALDHLLVLLRTLVMGEDTGRLDNLDQRRRFEFVYPTLGLQIDRALEQSVEECAKDLLVIAETHCAHWAGWPAESVAVVRQRLDWEA